jgi:hypothetical protein
MSKRKHFNDQIDETTISSISLRNKTTIHPDLRQDLNNQICRDKIETQKILRDYLKNYITKCSLFNNINCDRETIPPTDITELSLAHNNPNLGIQSSHYNQSLINVYVKNQTIPAGTIIAHYHGYLATEVEYDNFQWRIGTGIALSDSFAQAIGFQSSSSSTDAINSNIARSKLSIEQIKRMSREERTNVGKTTQNGLCIIGDPCSLSANILDPIGLSKKNSKGEVEPAVANCQIVYNPKGLIAKQNISPNNDSRDADATDYMITQTVFYIEAIKDIHPGDELFFSYSNDVSQKQPYFQQEEDENSCYRCCKIIDPTIEKTQHCRGFTNRECSFKNLIYCLSCYEAIKKETNKQYQHFKCKMCIIYDYFTKATHNGLLPNQHKNKRAKGEATSVDFMKLLENSRSGDLLFEHQDSHTDKKKKNQIEEEKQNDGDYLEEMMIQQNLEPNVFKNWNAMTVTFDMKMSTTSCFSPPPSPSSSSSSTSKENQKQPEKMIQRPSPLLIENCSNFQLNIRQTDSSSFNKEIPLILYMDKKTCHNVNVLISSD